MQTNRIKAERRALLRRGGKMFPAEREKFEQQMVSGELCSRGSSASFSQQGNKGEQGAKVRAAGDLKRRELESRVSFSSFSPLTTMGNSLYQGEQSR